MQNFAALALLASSLSPLAQANDDSYIDLDETYTNSFNTNFGKRFKIKANMKITGNVSPDGHGGESLIEGKTSIWVNKRPYLTQSATPKSTIGTIYRSTMRSGMKTFGL